MLKMTIIGFLITVSSCAQAQVNVDSFGKEPDWRERLNPLNCETKEWSVFINQDDKSSKEDVMNAMALITPHIKSNEQPFTNIAYFLEIAPDNFGERISYVGNRMIVNLREIKHEAVPSSYSQLKKSTLEKLVSDLKTLPGVHIICSVPMPMGRMSGSNRR